MLVMETDLETRQEGNLPHFHLQFIITLTPWTVYNAVKTPLQVGVCTSEAYPIRR